MVTRASRALDAAGLTGAERAVVEDALRGLSNRAIAAKRGVSERTVANQLSAIYRKLRVGSRPELARAITASGARASRGASPAVTTPARKR